MSKGGGRTKNLRYPSELDEIFKDDIVDNMEDAYVINVDQIEVESKSDAVSSITNLLKLYNDEQFCEEHPEFKKRIDTEVNSLRKMYKMSKSNEELHDHLLVAISNHPDNASLYNVLTKLQGNILEIDKRIKEIMKEFTSMCKSYQTEMNFNKPDEVEEEGIMNKGSKAFIDMMNNSAE